MQLHHEGQENTDRTYKKSQAYSAFNVAQVFTQASLEWDFWIKVGDSLQ